MIRGFIALGLGFVVFLLSSSVHSSAQPAEDGKTLFTTVCSQCHSLEWPERLRDGPLGWKQRVDWMILQGAQLTPAEEATLVAYLAANYGPGQTPMSSGPIPGPALADGPGKNLVDTHCLLCHDSGRLVDARRSRTAWTLIVRNMVAKMPSGFATPQEDNAIVDYLTAHYGVIHG